MRSQFFALCLDQRIMTQSRSKEHYKKVQQEKTFRVDSTSCGDTAHCGEYQRDYGPDLDWPLSRTEFGDES
jgi:hypothetical protein